MPGHVRHLMSHALGYGAGMVLSRSAGVVLVPIYTRVITPADYGLWGLIYSALAVLSVVGFLGLDTALARFFIESEGPEERRQVVGTAFWTVLACAVALTGLALAAAPVLAGLALGQPAAEPYLRLALLSVPFSALHGMHLAILRARSAVGAYNLLVLGNLALGAGLSVFLAAGLGYGLSGLLLGVLIGNVATALVGWWANREHIGAWTGPTLQRMLGVGLPLLPAGLAGWTMYYVDRWFLSHTVPSADLGLYETANRVTSSMSLPPQRSSTPGAHTRTPSSGRKGPGAPTPGR